MDRKKERDLTPYVAGGMVLGSIPVMQSGKLFHKLYENSLKDPDTKRFVYTNTIGGETIGDDLQDLITHKKRKIAINYGPPGTSAMLTTSFAVGKNKPKFFIDIPTENFLNVKKAKTSVPTLAHEIGHYKNARSRLWLRRFEKLMEKNRTGFLGPAAGGGVVYGGIKALGGSDEAALTGAGIGSLGTGLVIESPTLLQEGLASIEGLKGIAKYNKLTKNPVSIKKATKQLLNAFGTYASKHVGLGLMSSGLGLGTVYLAHRLKNKIKGNKND